jgi:hypothetical protein
MQIGDDEKRRLPPGLGDIPVQQAAEILFKRGSMP